MGKRSPRRGGGASICPAGIESSYVKEVLKTGRTTKDKTTNHKTNTTKSNSTKKTKKTKHKTKTKNATSNKRENKGEEAYEQYE